MYLDSPLVSKNHFRIYSIQYEDDDGVKSMFYCEDSESVNGTYVNDILIGKKDKPSTPYLLSDGDIITLRPDFSFEFKQSVDKQGEEEMDMVQIEEAKVGSPWDRVSFSPNFIAVVCRAIFHLRSTPWKRYLWQGIPRCGCNHEKTACVQSCRSSGGYLEERPSEPFTG
jgi:pSer/pThr/pTyr-binding forkhead associated (FHA) protein